MLIGVAVVEFSQPRQSDSCNKWREIIFAQICVDSLCAICNYQSVVAIILVLSVVDSVQSIQKTAVWRLMHTTVSSWSQAVREGKRTPHAARRGFSAKRHRRVFNLAYSTGKGTAGTSSFQDLYTYACMGLSLCRLTMGIRTREALTDAFTSYSSEDHMKCELEDERGLRHSPLWRRLGFLRLFGEESRMDLNHVHLGCRLQKTRCWTCQ
jgi:hypothetical protein